MAELPKIPLRIKSGAIPTVTTVSYKLPGVVRVLLVMFATPVKQAD